MALGTLNVKGTFNIGLRRTETAGTAIVIVIPPARRGARTRITGIVYTNGSTAHTLRVLKALARTTVATAAAINATTLVVTSASFRGDTLAASDYIVVQHDDGTYGAYLVSAVATVTTLTIANHSSPATTGLSVACAAGNRVWLMGAIGEAEHRTILAVASVVNSYNDAVSGLASSGYRSVASGTVYTRSGNDDPLIAYSNNATAAGAFESVSGYYGSP